MSAASFDKDPDDDYDDEDEAIEVEAIAEDDVDDDAEEQVADAVVVDAVVEEDEEVDDDEEDEEEEEDGYDRDAVADAVTAAKTDDVDDDLNSEGPPTTKVVEAQEVLDTNGGDDNADAGDNEDGEEEEVMEAMVIDEGMGVAEEMDEEVEAAVVVAEEPDSSPRAVEEKAAKKPAKKKVKKKKASKKKRSRKGYKGSGNYGSVPPERVEAAADAREALQASVPTLPVAVGESRVRSFGRLYIEPDMEQSRFSTASALYPIGFSCDRYEFSPVHGRILKLRCSILSGQRIKEKQRSKGLPESTELHDGPVFRIMWGQGVDEDVDGADYPFDPYRNASPDISEDMGEVLAIPDSAVTSSSSKRSNFVFPEEGMRVKVRFDKKQSFYGSIVEMEQPDKKRKEVAVRIRYDDGSFETVTYPDPDIELKMPGAEEEIDEDGEVELLELNGKPITSVVGTSALEAWGKILMMLGLIDEIMFENAFIAVQTSREEGIKKAEDKSPSKQKKSGQEKSDESPSRAQSPASPNGDGQEREEKKDGEDNAEQEEESSNMEEPSVEENELRQQMKELLNQLSGVKEKDRIASINLADARINVLGLFMCNPFHDDDSGKAQQGSWLATAVRREKTRMGSTGNKRKVVTALDLLERNDSLYNADIEGLIEGLPGSEYCRSYVYQAFRAGGASAHKQTWVQEAALRERKESIQRQKKAKETRERQRQEKEREKKKRKREEERDARKRQKLEEEDQKKKVRIEERLCRLRIQVEDRLNKEAAFQREKVVLALAKNLSKEFYRRRKAAELVAGQVVVESKGTKSPIVASASSPLPRISKIYDEDTVRVWNFMATFGSFFLRKGYATVIPTLDSLQTAIDCLRGITDESSISRADAITELTNLAVSLCKPLSASLTRVLFASLIALYPSLQKDYGAAFFNEVNATAPKNDDPEAMEEADADEASRPDVLLPVTATTWQEVARLTFLSDGLSELGYARHEAAHLLRGYRSAGHPNSKESKRLRGAEDFSVGLIRQEVARNVIEEVETPLAPVRIGVPCTPVVKPCDFRFFLHIVKSLPDTAVVETRANISKALDLVMKSNDEGASICKPVLERILELLKEVGSSDPLPKQEIKVLKKARTIFLDIYKKVAGPPKSNHMTEKSKAGADSAGKLTRQRMGLLNSLRLTKVDYKKLDHKREQYMDDALRLKEEMERQKLKEDDDDDDDEDEDEGENGVSQAEVVANGVDTKESLPVEQNTSEPAVSAACAGEGTTPPPSSESGDKETLVVAEVEVAKKIGKETPYDDFCADFPNAPELLRRCLAVLRTLSVTGPADPFHYPVDPQSNPGYYDMVMRPMCLREVGKQLMDACKKLDKMRDDAAETVEEIESVVAQFGRNVRLINQNCLAYTNAGPMIISAGSELLRIFERLFLDWVLAPQHLLPPLDKLDDDRCVEHHDSDEQSTVLLCDGCEGKYNISRLNPPLKGIPKGEWYCPRCISGRWWGDLDPRIGCVVRRISDVNGQMEAAGSQAKIIECLFRYPEGVNKKPSLMYRLKFQDKHEETWSLFEVDQALNALNTPVAPVRCLEAVAESPGYGFGVDYGLRMDLVPVPLNPNISDAAAQVTLSSSVFRDTITASATLLVIDPQDMTASEWLRLLVLLVMKCSSSDLIQNVVSEMENEAAEKMAASIEVLGKVSGIRDILPEIDDGDDDEEVSPDPSISKPPIAVSVKVPAVKTEEQQSSSTVLAQETKLDPPAVPSATISEPTAVEVVDEVNLGANPTEGGSPMAKVTEVYDEKEAAIKAIITVRRKRQKAIEDCILAYSVKNQLRPAVASFEEENISEVVDQSLPSTDLGLNFSSLRCRRMTCSFCGLTDLALGLPLVRVPSEEEWDEVIPHCERARVTNLIAEITEDTVGAVTLCPKPETMKPRFMAMKVRVEGEIMSFKSTELDTISEGGGILEFCPRSEQGFQNELKFRSETGIPFVTGSLSGHECCAIAAHNARKEQMVQKYKKHQAELIEKESGMTCGRTLEIGRDGDGRSYWKLYTDSEALFVCVEETNKSDASVSTTWHRFGDAPSIASVLISLGRDPIVKDLQRFFPAAHQMVKDETWRDGLLKRKFPEVAKLLSGKDKNGDSLPTSTELIQVKGGFEPYEKGEDVLVESVSGQVFWDASVKAVSKRIESSGQTMIDAYRVQYRGWSSRFTEWVDPARVVEPNENNRLLQAELLEDIANSACGLPTSLNQLAAKEFLYARDRARGIAPLPDFARIAFVDESKSENEKAFNLMKAAVLAIEAALPLGAINATDSGPWRYQRALRWRQMVQNATGPAALIQCVLLLEENITEEWVKEDVGHLRSCLPSRWKALGEASPSSLALRVILLDRSIKYATVDRKRFGSKKKRSGNNR